MILHPTQPGCVAVLQSAHGLLAFQLAEHWGNRTTPRPSPRPEVLVAALLHDAGWDGAEPPPRLTSERQVVAFDTLPREERELLWRNSVERAGLRGRYVAYLVSHHVSCLASRHGTQAFSSFQQQEEARRQRLRKELDSDPRYSQAIRTRGDEVNRAIVRLTDAISVHLCRGTAGQVNLGEIPQVDGGASLEMRSISPGAYRLHPWPLVGRRLQVHVEGRRLPSRSFANEASLREAWDHAEVVRLSWMLLPPGAPAIDTPAVKV